VPIFTWSRRRMSDSAWEPQAFPARGVRRAKRSAAVTAAAAAIVMIAGILTLAAGPGSKASSQTVSDQASNVPGHAGKPAARPAHTVHPAPPLRVTAMSPASGAHDVNGTRPVRVTFSAPLAASSPMPKVSPAIPGTWKREGDSAVFTPAAGFMGGTEVTVTVPGGSSGVQSAAGAHRHAGGLLAATVTRHFTTAPFSTLRLQQLLAQLGYLPLTWAPSGTQVPSGSIAAQLAAAYNPPPGTFTWASGYPSILGHFWQQGADNLIDTGAIRAFESQNGLTMDGIAGPEVWQALFHDVAAGKDNVNGYTYALASKASPETLTIWHDGHVVLHSLANTGIPAAPTADGTFPVYERLPFQIMKGTNPDGTKYADPVRYVSYFNGGDAVHYFPRASFGFPQSLGCVELPLQQAAISYRYLTYGSLVTVTG